MSSFTWTIRCTEVTITSILRGCFLPTSLSLANPDLGEEKLGKTWQHAELVNMALCERCAMEYDGFDVLIGRIFM